MFIEINTAHWKEQERKFVASSKKLINIRHIVSVSPYISADITLIDTVTEHTGYSIKAFGKYEEIRALIENATKN